MISNISTPSLSLSSSEDPTMLLCFAAQLQQRHEVILATYNEANHY